MEQKDSSKTNENKYEFTEAELADFKRFWKSPAGEKYMKKMKDTKEQLLDAAMGSMDNDYILRSTAIANGFQSVIMDVNAILNAYDDLNKKIQKEAKKSG